MARRRKKKGGAKSKYAKSRARRGRAKSTRKKVGRISPPRRPGGRP